MRFSWLDQLEGLLSKIQALKKVNTARSQAICCVPETSIKLTLCAGRILWGDMAYTLPHSQQNNSQGCKQPLEWALICLGRQTQEDKVYMK